MNVSTRASLMAAILLMLSGCGDLISSVKEGIDQLLEIASQASIQTASEFVSDADAALSVVDVDATSDDALDELEQVDVDSLAGGGGAQAPSLKGFEAFQDTTMTDRTPRLGERDADRPVSDDVSRTVEIERYAGGRIKLVRISQTIEADRTRSETRELFLRYSSTTEVTGDLNDAAPQREGGPAAYVYATVTGTVTFSDDSMTTDSAESATLSGFRHWYSGDTTRFVEFHLVQDRSGLSDPAFQVLEWQGHFDGTTGTFVRDVVFGADETDHREWVFSRDDSDAGRINIDYMREAPSGVTAEGHGYELLNGTPGCRLDDDGEFQLVRVYPEAETTDVVPVRETIVTTREGLETVVHAELELSDGTVLTREQTRTIIEPTSCADRADADYRRVRVVATSYSGVRMASVVTRYHDGPTIFESRRRNDAGETIRTEAIRFDGVTHLRAIVRNADGEIVAIVELRVDPSGRAHGTQTRLLENGEQEVLEIDRDVNGEFFVQRSGVPAPIRHTISRGMR